MRQRAAESDVVIVNHHLLCADASVRQSAFGEVIPSCRYAIVDEAHQLEDVATQYFGTAVSNYRVDDYARDVDRAIAAKQIPDRDAADTLRDDIDNVRDGARLFFGTLQMLRFEGARPAAGEPHPRHARRVLERAAADAAALVRALEALEATIALAKDLPEDVIALGRRAAELKRDVQFLMRADDPGHVYYLDIRGRGVFLRASPIDVSDIIREMLLDRMTATVLTSATLSVDGRFDYVRSRLGVRAGARSAAAVGVRLHAAGDPLPAEEDARPAVAGVRRRGGARSRRDPEADARARVRAVHELREPARRSTSSPPPRSTIRSSSRAPRRGRRCCASSRRRPTPCCSPRPASGRASTSSASP